MAPALRVTPTSSVVSVRGAVFDSLTGTPLSGARIALTPVDAAGGIAARATTDAGGAFAVSLRSGSWLAAVEHPRFDSLRVTIPPRRVEVPRKAAFALALGTPSPATVTRALCGSGVRHDDVALVGIVRNAATRRGVDSASVYVKWVDLTLRLNRLGVARSTETLETRTTRDGWYVSCGVPAEATLLSWAARGSATTGAVVLTLARAPARLDLAIDTTARPSSGSADLEPDSSGISLFPMSAGTARYHVIVRDVGARPVANARVRILGRKAVRSDAAGAVTLDSIVRGTQTLEVLSVGYQPERRMVDVEAGGEPTDTIVLTSLRSVLDTVRVTAGRDPTGFEVRRGARVGQFITTADIARENPVNTTRLLRTRSGLRYTYDRHGFPEIAVTTQTNPCRPLLLIDGFPPGPAPTAPGEAVLDWIVHPDEIGGVEIYTTRAQIPPEIARLGIEPLCGAIVLWTRQRLGLPGVNPALP